MVDHYIRGKFEDISKWQETHDKTEKETFVEIFKRLGKIDVQIGKMLLVVGLLNMLGGTVLTIVGMIIAKKLGF